VSDPQERAPLPQDQQAYWGRPDPLAAVSPPGLNEPPVGSPLAAEQATTVPLLVGVQRKPGLLPWLIALLIGGIGAAVVYFFLNQPAPPAAGKPTAVAAASLASPTAATSPTAARLQAATVTSSPPATAINAIAASTPQPLYYAVSRGVPSQEMIVTTNKGVIVAELYATAAPTTIAQFATRANRGDFDGRRFHRYEDWLVQGNDPTCTDLTTSPQCGNGGGALLSELNDIPFQPGSIGMARTAWITYTNADQFFIVKQSRTYPDLSFLNNKLGANGLPIDGYTNIGKVTDGEDVVRNLRRDDTIQSVRVLALPASTPSLPASGQTVAPTLPAAQQTGQPLPAQPQQTTTNNMNK